MNVLPTNRVTRALTKSRVYPWLSAALLGASVLSACSDRAQTQSDRAALEPQSDAGDSQAGGGFDRGAGGSTSLGEDSMAGTSAVGGSSGGTSMIDGLTGSSAMGGGSTMDGGVEGASEGDSAVGGASMVDGGAGRASMGLPAFAGATGSACKSDSDCFGGMICRNEWPLGGRVAGGYCTLSCESSDDCQAVDATALCPVGEDRNKFCVAVCQPGAGVLVPGAVECAARGDLACGPALNEQGFAACEPRCVDDTSCGAGLFCDFGTGECVAEAAQGSALGVACTADDACASRFCAKLNPDDPLEIGFCSGLCRLGIVAGCGFGNEVEGQRTAGCIPSAGQGDDGDTGICGRLCDTDADCQGETFACAPLGAAAVAVWRRAGVCLANAGDSASAPLGDLADPSLFSGTTGSACDTDADCFGGMTCLREWPLGGNVAGGYCALPCSSNDDCQAVDAAALCQSQPSNDGNAYCVGLCQPGEAVLVPEVGECGNRDDMVCGSPIDLTGVGICEPRCIDDASCGAGLFCELGTGECTTVAPLGAALGASCTADESCASRVCAKANPEDREEVGFCSGLCRFGIVAGCGFDNNVADGQRTAGCLFSTGQGSGDSGLCAAFCDEEADCEGEGFVCEPLGETLAQVWSRSGVCLPPIETGIPAAGVAGI